MYRIAYLPIIGTNFTNHSWAHNPNLIKKRTALAYNNDKIRSQFCTYHNSCAHQKQNCSKMFFTGFQLKARNLIAKGVSCVPFENPQFRISQSVRPDKTVASISVSTGLVSLNEWNANGVYIYGNPTLSSLYIQVAEYLTHWGSDASMRR